MGLGICMGYGDDGHKTLYIKREREREREREKLILYTIYPTL